MYLNLTARGKLSSLEWRHYADSTLLYQLQRIPGVASIDIWGGKEREIQVLVDRSRLEATGISLARVLEVVSKANITKVGGHLESGRTDYVVRPLGEFRSLSEPLPSVDEGMMYVRVELPVGTRMDITDRVLADIERTVHATAPDVQAMFARTGLSWRGGGGTHTGFLWVRLKDLSQRQQSLPEVIRVLQQKLSNYPGAQIRIVERPSDVARLLGSGRSERLEVDVFGFDLHRGRALAQVLAKQIKELEGISYVRLNIDDSRPEIQMVIDRQKADAVGVSIDTILQSIETSMAGTVASKYREGRDEYDIRVRLQETDRREIADLERIFVMAPGGQKVPLRSLTVSKPGTGPVVIERRGQERAVTLQAGMNGSRDFGRIAADVEHLLASVNIPQGFQAKMGGERAEQQQSNQNMTGSP